MFFLLHSRAANNSRSSHTSRPKFAHVQRNPNCGRTWCPDNAFIVKHFPVRLHKNLPTFLGDVQPQFVSSDQDSVFVGHGSFQEPCIDILMMAFLMIFRRFRTTFRRFPKMLQNLSKGHKNLAKHFSKLSKDNQILPKTFEEDLKMFQWYTNEFKYNLRDKFDISEIINIFTSEDMENTPPESRMWFRMNFTSGVFSSKTLLSI